MNESIETRLDRIVGKTYNYKGKNVTIEKYKQVKGMYVVFMPGPHNFLMHEVNAFLEMLHEQTPFAKTETQVFVPKKELVTFEPTKENANIKATLLETLEKIKTDPNYLPQASAICNVVNQLVQVQKNEIQMLGIINKFK